MESNPDDLSYEVDNTHHNLKGPSMQLNNVVDPMEVERDMKKNKRNRKQGRRAAGDRMEIDDMEDYQDASAMQ